MKLTIAVSEGLDKLNPKHETMLDIRIHDDALLSNMHNQIKKILQLNENDKYYYICEGSKEIAMDTSLSLKELGLGDSDKLYLESGRKRRKIQRNNKRNSSADGEDNDEDSNTEILDLICTTRIFESDNVPVRKVRVLVPSDQSCRYLIDDVSSLWGRVGLKFKCGRTVLHGDKTFDELGVESNSEIVVTGGRG